MSADGWLFQQQKGKFLFAYKNKRANTHFWFCCLSASAQSHRKDCADCAEDSPPHPSVWPFVSHRPERLFSLDLHHTSLDWCD